jgi:heme/copper-type cytochrome/quinol oxidase subunit 3
MTVTQAMGVRPKVDELPEHAAGPIAFGWWGMVWLICTEAMLFAALIASYFFLRFQTGPEWPPGDITRPSLELPLIMSAILWSSSIPVHFAERGIRRGNRRALKWGLLAGFVLGGTFLTLQLALEYPEVLLDFSPTDNAYGSLFFTLTGLHGGHVFVGLLFSVWTQIRAWRGAFTAERHLTVQNFAMYWHFVDVIWVFILASIYLSPYF